MSLTISYCITCKGRIGHLKKTLPANLQAEAGNEGVEFVVLDYDSQDGLADWLRTEFAAEIASGRVVHVSYRPAPHFEMAKAKNLSHLSASGDILCNLDADNYITDGYSLVLRRAFDDPRVGLASPRAIDIPTFIRLRYLNKAFGRRRPEEGLGGRVAIRSEIFRALRGYDEQLSGWGGDDIDLILRVRDNGYKIALLPEAVWGEVIKHDDQMRTENMGVGDQAKSVATLTSSRFSDFRRNVVRLAQNHGAPSRSEGARANVLVYRNHSPTPVRLAFEE